ncbi:hypothetical protein ACNIRO_10230, partial [Escherichia coli]
FLNSNENFSMHPQFLVWCLTFGAHFNFGKENEQWLDRLSLSDAERFIEEGHFAKGSMLPKVEAAASFARSRAGREALITVLSKAKEGIEGKTGTVICQ